MLVFLALHHAAHHRCVHNGYKAAAAVNGLYVPMLFFFFLVRSPYFSVSSVPTLFFFFLFFAVQVSVPLFVSCMQAVCLFAFFFPLFLTSFLIAMLQFNFFFF